MFISYAPNLEDVVLWRALGDVERGTYVEVGASDTVVDSSTWAFYRRGWRGALLEPVPWRADARREQRPDDITIAAAAGAKRDSVCLSVAPPARASTHVDPHGDEMVGSHAADREIVVPVAPLDDLLAERPASAAGRSTSARSMSRGVRGRGTGRLRSPAVAPMGSRGRSNGGRSRGARLRGGMGASDTPLWLSGSASSTD